MAITNGYCTETQLREWNRSNSTATTLTLERAIEACSRGIDRFCERVFYSATGARLFDACWVDGRYIIELGPYNDLTGITTVKTDDNRDGVFETTWSASDYQLHPLNAPFGPEAEPYTEIHPVGTRAFPVPTTGVGRVGLVQITCSAPDHWGWPAEPTAINQACVMHAARIFNRKESPQGVAGWGEFGQIRIGRTDPDVIAFLEPYQYYGVGFA